MVAAVAVALFDATVRDFSLKFGITVHADDEGLDLLVPDLAGVGLELVFDETVFHVHPCAPKCGPPGNIRLKADPICKYGQK